MIRAVDKWLIGYLRSVWRRPRGAPPCPRHLLFCVADHFEPFRLRPFDCAQGYGGQVEATRREALALVKRWGDEYPQAVEGLTDADGVPPRHTFFYPQEEYDAECIDALAALCSGGCGEVEIHLHHRDDSAKGLSRKLVEFRDRLHDRHGLLGTDASGAARYGFVHGNWALCNSRPDGDWCGVNEELGILRETGCYADFTFPSAPSQTQPRMVNAIYYAKDIPGRPRSHDRGALAHVRTMDHEREHRTSREAGQVERLPRLGGVELPTSKYSHTPILPHFHTGLMLIQGPLGLNWKRRKWGILPRLENAEIFAANPPVPARIELWVRQHVHVSGRPEWVFVKVHTHGCIQENMDVFLDTVQGSLLRPSGYEGQAAFNPSTGSTTLTTGVLRTGVKRMHEFLREKYNDGKDWALHYVTAREMYNIARAAEDGREGNPGAYRDYEIAPPACAAR